MATKIVSSTQKTDHILVALESAQKGIVGTGGSTLLKSALMSASCPRRDKVSRSGTRMTSDLCADTGFIAAIS
jgi:hypothetical protein